MLSLVLACLLGAEPEAPFAIKVVDEETGRGVPLIELRTVSNQRYLTDSNGLVAFREPGLMHETIFFYVAGHGYEYPKDGFGYRGKAIAITPGGSTTLKMKRLNRAERLYRLTGEGIYADTVLLGQKAPLKAPLLNGRVFGQDSVVNVPYQGKLFWVWGDTHQPAYPLGNFHAPGATSELPGHGGLDPSVGVDLTYLVDQKGFAKKITEMPGKGPTWINTLVTLNDATGRERLYCSYIKVEADMKIYARGIAVFDDAKQQFEKVADFDLHAPLFPNSHSFKHRDGDRDYYYFAYSYPLIRVPATVADFTNPASYEGYTCLKEGSRLSDALVERTADGKVHYAWKKNTPVVGAAEQAKLIRDKKLQPTEALLQLRDRDTGTLVTAHAGSCVWNEYRRCWTMITCEHFGKPSLLGEIWYAEAPTPVGPWTYAVKVVTHEKYSFYNPKLHPYFNQEGGKLIYFEGTYTHTFSGNHDQTPRYDYNQIMYRLDLSAPRNALPVPVQADGSRHTGTGPVAFYAYDRPVPEAVRLATSHKDSAFYLLPTTLKNPPSTTTLLYQFHNHDRTAKRYSTNPRANIEGYTVDAQPLGRVWKNPLDS